MPAATIAWDQDGNPVYAEPSRIDTERRRTALLQALSEPKASVQPYAESVKAEVAAAQASRPAPTAVVQLALPRHRPWSSPQRGPGPVEQVIAELKDCSPQFGVLTWSSAGRDYASDMQARLRN